MAERRGDLVDAQRVVERGAIRAPLGRFADAINYLKLGWAILQEREQEIRKAAASPLPPSLVADMTRLKQAQSERLAYDAAAIGS